MVGRDVLIAPHVHEPWLLRGGFEDVVRIPTGGWRFPWCDGFTDGLTVFADGEIRPALRAPHFPRPFDASLAVVPAFNWHLLPGGVSNVFWHASTPSNSLVVAWENAPVGCDANCLTNFQAEFFTGGQFSYRYDDRVVDYAPVFPFDWDNDGLENMVDPDPLTAGPDAHGTNAEWYNTVCSNVFETESWRMGVNSNAYYFVDVVAELGPAPIYFTGDRVSRLGNPVVVAMGGETNRVPLLIGVNYAVTSSVPIAVSVPANSAPRGAGACYAAVTTNGVSNCVVQWPLDFTFNESIGDSSRVYEVSVGPYDPGGELTWNGDGGEHGGWLSVASNNLDKLVPVGDGVPLPISRSLAAEEVFHATGVYEGAAESAEENDVTMGGTFTEYVTAQQHQSGDALTVVKVELRPHVTAPQNDVLGRHEYGVCELLEYNQHPSTPAVTWNPVGGGSNTLTRTGRPCYQFPLFACENPLQVELDNALYVPRLSCIEPSGIEVREVDLCTYGLPAGKAGGIGLLQAFYVKPLTVSFSEIAVEEVPSANGLATGYFRYAFTSNLWSHTSDAGAGRWLNVSVHNRMGGTDFRDEAAISIELLPITPDGILTNDYSFGWMDGTMTWEVPFGWNAKGTENGTEPFGTFEDTTQEFYIDRGGFVGVRKFRNQATRYVNDARYLNWRRIYNNEVRNP